MWESLLSTSEEITLPWLGGRRLQGRSRSWQLTGRLPPVVGWHRFTIDGSRRARWAGEGWLDPELVDGLAVVRGYLIGDRLIADGVVPALGDDPTARLLASGERVWLVEAGLERFARAAAVRLPDGRLVYSAPEFPLGPEHEVLEAFQDARESLDGIAGVTPALHLSFLCQLEQRRAVARRRARLEAERLEAERQARFARAVEDGAVRRELAREDVEAAARAALAVSGARLLDVRPSHQAGEVVVQFELDRERFECVIERDTLRIVDAGICLEDHATGERGDTRFTLESLPAVIDEARRTHRLVVWRR